MTQANESEGPFVRRRRSLTARLMGDPEPCQSALAMRDGTYKPPRTFREVEGDVSGVEAGRVKKLDADGIEELVDLHRAGMRTVEMAETLGVTQGTLNHAITALIREGRLVSRKART